MRAHAFLIASVLGLSGCFFTTTRSPVVESAGDEARTLADEYFTGFKLVSERGVEPGSEPKPTKVKLKEGQCYRFIAVRAEGEATEDIRLNFSHSETIVEAETDFTELSENDGELRKQRVVWGTCVWPNLVGELTIYENLAATGGYMVVLEADARTLDWKQGYDVRNYLQGKGIVDIEALERQEAETELNTLAAEHHRMLPPILYESYPAYTEVVSTHKPGWNHPMMFAPKTCYHLFITSLNCLTEYEVTTLTGDVVHDDGTPYGVGRLGWSHDFCPGKKQTNKQGALKVKLEKDSQQYDSCWFTVAVYEYQVSNKEKKELQAEVAEEREQADALVDECLIQKQDCTSACPENDAACMSQCADAFVTCAGDILFEGQVG